MVRQYDADNLFAKPGTARRHCMMVSACVVFDVAIYPLMIWFLFIDVPDFLRPPSNQEEERMVLFIKLAAMCGFTFVVCMYQVILFDLFGQHCLRMREAFSPSKSVSHEPVGTETEKDDEWNRRQEDPHSLHGLPAGHPAQPGLQHSRLEEDGAMMIPGVMPQNHMPVIEETPETVATMVQAIQPAHIQRHGARSQSKLNSLDEHQKAAGRSASSSVEPVADVRAEAVPKKAGKSHEKTVSFDRETVFTYIKQTPVQTPR
eukprot:symbB.v1.2.021739.t1/scaffold1896.1/size96813/10